MSGWLKNIAAKLAAKKKRIAEIALGHTVSHTLDYLFDYALYIPVIIYLGPIKGGVLMTILSAIACLLTLRFYDWSGKDWLGLEALKELKNPSSKFRWMQNKLAKILIKIIQKGDAPAFFALSIYFDPFYTTVYLRQKGFNGLTPRDWKIF